MTALTPLVQLGRDGETHINTNKETAVTQLGKMLDRASNIPVRHPVLGRFRTARNFELWITSDDYDDRLRSTTIMPKRIGKCQHQQALVVEAIYYKILRNRVLKGLVCENTLPYDYYWRQGAGVSRIKTRPVRAIDFVSLVSVACELIKTGTDVTDYTADHAPSIYSNFAGLLS